MVLISETAQPRSGSGKRHTWMDLCRGAAVLLVVVWHVFSAPAVFGGYEPPELVYRLNDALSPFRIPLLLVLSGMLLERSLAKGLPRYYTGKLRAIAWPYVLWGLATLLVQGSLSASTSIWFWLGGNIHWYLVVILFCYIVAPIKLIGPLKRLPWWVAVVAPLALLWIATPGTNAVNRFLWFGAFFFVGVSISHLVERWQRTRGVIVAVAAGLALVGGVATALGRVAPQRPLFFAIAILGVAVLLWVAPRIARGPFIRTIEWYGRNSIVVYVGHAFAMFGTMNLLRALGVHESPWVMLAMAAVGFGVPTLLIIVREHMEWAYTFPSFGAARHEAVRP